MELVFDMVSAQQFAPGLISSKTFKQAGGIIGRAEDCDWVIPDRKRVLSSRHAEVSYPTGHSSSPTPVATAFSSKTLAPAWTKAGRSESNTAACIAWATSKSAHD